MRALKDKPGPSPEDKKEAEGMFKGTDAPLGKQFSAAGEINTDVEGYEIGLITTTPFHFKKPGDRLVGYLKCRSERCKGKDTFKVYEVYNLDGDWSFFGSKLVEDKIAEMDDKVILDITYTDDKMSTQRGQNYKDYKVKYYPWPSDVDPCQVRCGLKEDGKTIHFIDFPSDLGATAKEPDNTEESDEA